MALNAILPELECLLYSHVAHSSLCKLTSSEKMLDAGSAAKIIDNHIKCQTIIFWDQFVCREFLLDIPRYILDIMSNLRVIMVMAPLNTLSGK